MQKRWIHGSGEPSRVIALSSARFRLGLDLRKALGPAGMSPAQTAGHVTAPAQFCINVTKPLPRRRPHVTRRRHSTMIDVASALQLLADFLRPDARVT